MKAIISIGGTAFTFNGSVGDPQQDTGYWIAEDGIEGWLGMPGQQTSVTARGQGDGNHDVTDDAIHYASRTITMHAMVSGDAQAGEEESRALMLRRFDALRKCAHRHARLRVIDGARTSYAPDAWCEGRMTVEAKPTGSTRILGEVTVTLECDRPEIQSTATHQARLYARDATSGAKSIGMSYNQPGFVTWWQGVADNSPSVMDTASNVGAWGLAYPLTYKRADAGVTVTPHAGILTNGGTSRAYPTFTVNGPFPNGFRLEFPDLQASIACTQPVYATPLVLDSRARTATVGGLDVSHTLTSRGFPVIQPGGDLRVILATGGAGWVECQSHDTWM